MAGTSTINFGLLGELRVTRAGAGLRLGGRQQRAVLALLLVEANHVVSIDQLADALWSERVPNGAIATLQTYVSHLRDVLDPGRLRGGSGELLATEPGGYRLRVPVSSLDAAVFEQRARTGRALLNAGQFLDASAELAAALLLWRGPVLADLADYPFARLAGTRLEELRMGVVEARVAADLAVGRHHEIVAELEGLVAANPLREQLHAQRMLALYRCGRQAEALDGYTKLRESLAEELGIDPGPPLQELQQAILRQDPALTLPPRPKQLGWALPVPPNPLLGRQRELGELTGLLRSRAARLLVVTGAGGSGKTRLALETAHEVADSFANAALFVPLAPLHDPDLMMAAIAQAVGVQGAPGGSLDALAAVLHTQELLLVVDNVEQLRAATPDLVDLLARVPGLSLLITSRVVLHLSGERVYPVEPLPPDAAVTLFVERAREAELRFDPGDGTAIARICERLDQLPLAIELAASRVRVLTPGELLARLDRRLPVISGGARDLPERQQTLRATIAWSVDLLTDAERQDLYRLAVFAGGCTLQAAEAVCGITLDRLGTLIDHSLLHRLPTDQGSRYVMLDTIREFADEHLRAADELDEIRRRYAGHILTVAESAHLDDGEDGEQRHHLVMPERDNIRAALDWALDAGEIEFGLRLAVALENYWATNAAAEGMRWFEILLPLAGQVPPLLHARAVRCYGAATYMSGAYDSAERLYEQSLAQFRALRDDGHGWDVVARLAESAHERGDRGRARQLAEQSLEGAERGAKPKLAAEALGRLGRLACEDGDYAHGMDLLERSAAAAADVGFWWWHGLMLGELAQRAQELGRTRDAESWCRLSLAVLHRLGDRENTLELLGFLARSAAETGQVEEAGHLWGAVEAEESRAPLGWWATYREGYATALLAHSGAEFDRGRDVGREMSFVEAVAYAALDHGALR